MQDIVATLIVVLAVLYACWRFLPTGAKQSLVRRLVGKGKALGLSEARAVRIARTLEQSGTCGSCDSCKACATPAEKSGQPLDLRH